MIKEVLKSKKAEEGSGSISTLSKTVLVIVFIIVAVIIIALLKKNIWELIKKIF